MEIQSLVELAAGGNLKAVEDEWMAKLESDSASPETVAQMLPLITTLMERGDRDEAATLAWTTLELLGERFDVAEVLCAAGPMLLKLNHSEELRQQVTELYRRAYADRTGLETLLAEAGIAGGRPMRRALRTLEVCLKVTEGTFLAARHEDVTAQVRSLDPSTWTVQVTDGEGSESTYGPVEFADTYQPVQDDDCRVLRDFDRDRLCGLLNKDPARVVTSILRSKGDRIYGEELKDLLCPSLIESKNWSRWWTKARTALKRSPHVRIEGRAPYVLRYLPVAQTLEQESLEHFATLTESAAQLAAVEAYLRECTARKRDPDPDFVSALSDQLETRARRQVKAGGKLALGIRLVQRRIDQVLARTDAQTAIVALLRSADDPVGLICLLESVPQWEAACECLDQALPQQARELYTSLLLRAPQGVCDLIASRLLDLGLTTEQFDELVQQILADPVRHNQALFWLWDGPAVAVGSGCRLITVLTRILSALRERNRHEGLTADQGRQMVTSARSALAARKHERYRACLEQIDPGMALALLTQVRQLSSLGRAVHEDLQKLIRNRFPDLTPTATVEPWADDRVLFVTAQGLGRKQAERDELVNVKMKENAQRIGEAAALGDLSENSEYKFALEERDLLRARLAQMHEQLGIAQVLRTEDVRTDRIGVGTRATFRHLETGTPGQMVFLGPWEADIDRHVYNYKAPACQAVMGLSVGATTELTILDPPGTYEIVAIDSALA